MSGRSEFYKIHVGRHPLRVYLPPIWPFQCPMGIYKDHETSCSSFATTGHLDDHLVGQLAHHGPILRPSKLPCFNSSASPREFRFHHQLSEVSPNPSNSNGIPRLPDRLADNDSCSAKRKSQEGKERVPKCSKLPSGYCERISQADRPPDLYHSSCRSRSPPLPPLAGRQKQIACSVWVLRFPDPAFSPGIRGTSVV